MKKLSRWAEKNPVSAIVIIIVGQLVAVANAVAFGTLLFLFDWHPPSTLLGFAAVLFFFTFVLYPDDFRKRAFYTRRKVHDFGFIILTSIIIAVGTHNFVLESYHYYEPTPSNTAPARLTALSSEHASTALPEKPTSSTKKDKRRFKKQLRKKLRALKKRARQSKGEMSLGIKILLTITVVIVAFLLGFLVAILGCSIICNGLAVLGWIILIVGWVGIATLATFLIIKIFRKRKQKAPVMEELEEG